MAVDYVASLDPVTVSFLAAGETETVAFDVGTGSNRALLVQVAWRDRSNDITGVTYNGVAMTSLSSKITNGNLASRFFGMANPTSGSNNIAVTMGASTGSASPGLISAWAGDGIDQTTPFDAAVTANGSGSTANIVSSATLTTGATGDRAVFFHATYNETAVINATPTNYTERQDGNDAAGLSTEFGDADGASSLTGSATWSNGAYLVNWVALGVNANAAVSAVDIPVPLEAVAVAGAAPSLSVVDPNANDALIVIRQA